jgi:hypothetical protein
MQQVIKGHTYRPRPDPPPFVTVPWNSWTYTVKGKITAAGTAPVVVTPYTTTVKQIATQIAEAVGIASVFPVIKVLRATAWITANQPNGLITPTGTAAFYELAGYNNTDKSKREVVSDQGTLNMPACFGYVYPSVDQKEILDAATEPNQPVMATTTSGIAAGTEIEVEHRIQVLWKAKNDLFTAAEQL